MSFLKVPSWGSAQNLSDDAILSNEFPQVSFLLTSKTSSTSSVSQASSIWERIERESDEGRRVYEQFKEYSTTPDPKLPRTNSAAEYLDEHVFPLLITAIEGTLASATRWDVLWHQKSMFNGIDDIAEYLWNLNPNHSERLKNWVPIFEVPSLKAWLKLHPRPPMPLSWIWTDEEAALIIQAYYRGHLVRRTPEVQEVRTFWKALHLEKEEIDRQKREDDAKEMERMVQNALRQSLAQSELADIQEEEEIQKSATGFIRRALEVAWEKIKEEALEWERSMDRENIEPYMLLRRSLFQLDHMTDENYEKYFLLKKKENNNL